MLFREAVEQASAYYLIGFDPPDGKDGERKLQVRSKKGLTLRAPDRYFVGGATPPVTDAASALRATMASMFDSDDVPFTVATRLARPGSRRRRSSCRWRAPPTPAAQARPADRGAAAGRASRCGTRPS